MPEAISDRQLVAVLRPFVRACGPVLDTVREADPFKLRARPRGRGILGVLTSLRVPGTAAWAAMGPDRRANWWVNRFGRVTALITAIPGLGGVLADRLPVRDLVGVTAQSLVLCAIAGEYGITDTETRVRLIASVLFSRDVDPALIPAHKAEEDAEVDRLTGQLARPARKSAALSPRVIGGMLWRLARSLWGVTDELGKRPNGRWYHHLFGLLPLVGAVGDYFGERAGLRTARKRALRWLREH
jgi:hypothetical protein